MKTEMLCSIAVAAACCLPSASVFAAEPAAGSAAKATAGSAASAVIAPDKVNAKSIMRALSERFNASIDKDGDVKVLCGGLGHWININAKNKYLKFYLDIGLSKCPAAKVEALCRKFNSERVFVRFSQDDQEKSCVYGTYFMSYAGGLGEENLRDTMDWFCTVVAEFREDAAKLVPAEKQ